MSIAGSQQPIGAQQPKSGLGFKYGDILEFTCCLVSFEGFHFCATDKVEVIRYNINTDTWEVIAVGGANVATFRTIDLEQNTNVVGNKAQPVSPPLIPNIGDLWDVHTSFKASSYLSPTVNAGSRLEVTSLALASRLCAVRVILPSTQTYREVIRFDDLTSYCSFYCQGPPQPAQPQTPAHAQTFLVPKATLVALERARRTVLEPTPGPRCECGSAAIGHPGHSSWCPLYRSSP